MSPAERKAFAESIRPEVKGQSDKFSWRLYQRALLRGRERVYISACNNITGKPHLPDFAALKAGDRKQRAWLMIGEAISDDAWFHGAQMQGVTRKGARIWESYAHSPGFNTKAWIDVTDWFWTAYLARGRCIIHGDYAHKWLQINRNARKCTYCGKHEHRTVITRKKIERLEVWA